MLAEVHAAYLCPLCGIMLSYQAVGKTLFHDLVQGCLYSGKHFEQPTIELKELTYGEVASRKA